MSDERNTEDMIYNSEHFLNTMTTYLGAMPDENQHIIRQVTKQLQGALDQNQEYIKGATGLEPIWTFKKTGIMISKRILHPGQGERLSGADILLSKIVDPDTLGVSAVQVKRNRGKEHFEFETRDLEQLKKFRHNWRGSYYLMVDETVTPPADCFIATSELSLLVRGARARTKGPVIIRNSDLIAFCRGSNPFYDMFYRCRRGIHYNEGELTSVASRYVTENNRIVLELRNEIRVN